MRFIEDRISVICNELKELAFVKKEPVKGVVYKKGLYFYPYEADQSAEPWEEFDSKTMHWYGPDEHIGSEQNILFRRVWMEKLFISRWQHR